MTELHIDAVAAIVLIVTCRSELEVDPPDDVVPQPTATVYAMKMRRVQMREIIVH